MTNQRKKYSAEEKVGLLRLHLIEKSWFLTSVAGTGSKPKGKGRTEKKFDSLGRSYNNTIGWPNGNRIC